MAAVKFPVNHLTLWKPADRPDGLWRLSGWDTLWPGAVAWEQPEHRPMGATDQSMWPLPSDLAFHLSPPTCGPTPALPSREQALTAAGPSTLLAPPRCWPGSGLRMHRVVWPSGLGRDKRDHRRPVPSPSTDPSFSFSVKSNCIEVSLQVLEEDGKGQRSLDTSVACV